MQAADLIQVWKEIRNLRLLAFQIAMYVEGLQRTLDVSTPDFRDQRVKHEEAAREFYGRAYNHEVRTIDDIIRRLESV
jgi:hypothetical protein